LEETSATEVSSIINNPPQDAKYQALKDALISVYDETQETKNAKLLAIMGLGDRKPTGLLRYMRSLCDDVNQPLFRAHFLVHLPLDVRRILARNPPADIEALAKEADAIMQVKDTQAVNQLEVDSIHQPGRSCSPSTKCYNHFGVGDPTNSVSKTMPVWDRNSHEQAQHDPPAEHPFQKIHADLFKHGGRQFMVVVDEYSGWPTLYIDMGTHAHADEIIDCLKQFFKATAIPKMFLPHNGPQFKQQSVVDFLHKWGAKYDPSAPRLPSTNSRAEAAVQATKKIVRGTYVSGSLAEEDNVTERMRVFKNACMFGGRSPAELVLGRNVVVALPINRCSIDPKLAQFLWEMDLRPATTKYKYSKPIAPLTSGTSVTLQNDATKVWDLHGTVLETLHKHEYLIRTGSGRVWARNVRLIRVRHAIVTNRERKN
jgi:hypothetical protein